MKARVLSLAQIVLHDASKRIPSNANLPVSPDGVQLLVTSPAERGIRREPLSHQLLHYWRVLYRHRLQSPNAEAVWQSMPRVLQREAETVLKAERIVVEDANPDELARAFGVDLLTYARFASEELAYRYPGFDDWPVWRARFCEGFDEAAIFLQTRPVGTADPQPDPSPATHVPIEPLANDARRAFALAQRAADAQSKGNQARAAILFASAAKACSPGSTKYRTDAKEALRFGLIERLAPILQWDSQQQAEWKQAVQVLLAPAVKGHWSPPAKALYDLQNIAADWEGEVFAVDPWGWVAGLGQRPLLRKLGLSRVAQLHRKLLKVQTHILHSELAPADAENLLTLLQAEIQKAESSLRATMEPVLLQVFREVGFVPTTVVEEIALRKIVAELLDKTVDQGFLRLGDLRDTLARNQLKMPDLADISQFFAGDALLRADRALGESLDGVYYPGEFYLRWFQRGSALAFGTKLGRTVSLWFAAPFGAAFMTVEFAKYMVHEVTAISHFVAGLFKPAAEESHAHKGHGISMSPESIAIIVTLGFLFLGLIHSKPLRAFALKRVGEIGSALGWIFGTLPGAIWNSVPLRAIRDNPAVRWFNRRLAIPFLGAGVAALVGAQLDLTDEEYVWEVGGTFAFLLLMMNTPGGQTLQERLGEARAWLWRQIRTNFFPGLISLVAWFFHWLLGGLDRLIYSIDEWFRFRPGQAKPSLWLKVALAAIWFPVRYVLRFAIYLLIEPQINPIKHFPVVTVSHKLLLPMIPAISTATGIAKKWITGAMSGVPGIFGFLAWEVKENWRLYAANLPERLKPLALGHHGETMRGLLRPGLHSGTIPKAYGAIRRAAERHAPAKMQKSRDLLHHIEEAIHHFVDRELLAYLHSSKAWGEVPLHCEGVRLGLQHVRIEIRGTSAPAVIRFELVDSQVSGVSNDTAFLSEVSAEQRETWQIALLGFLAMGAVPDDDPRLNWNEWLGFWEQQKR